MDLDEYRRYDGLGLADLVKRGEVEATDLLETAIEAQAKIDPKLNSIVIDLQDEARNAVADDLPDGPFRGVPFLLKDLHLNMKGVRTTNGCRFFADAVSDHDSELVKRYRAAGLVIFGKTASPEFGVTTSTESVLFGRTHNPWSLEHTAGGSSGGASAAVAGGILPLANASDGGGSIRIPASCCGLVGMKPSRGNVPFGPDAGEGWSGMSTIHAVTRSVRDSAALLDATGGADVGAPYAAPPKERPYLEELSRTPDGLRIALVTDSFNGTDVHDDCVEAAEDAARLCESLGHRVEPITLKVDRESLGAATQAIIGGNLRATVEHRAATLGRDPGEQDLEPFTLRMYSAAANVTAADYARAQLAIHAAGRVVGSVHQRYDLVLTPTMGAPPEKLGVLSLSNENIGEMVGALLRSVAFTQLINATGQPAISLPLYWNSAGLPIGAHFIAPLGGEGLLYRLAGQLEAERPWFDRMPSV
jgi:Asp-tRNA(Asn)/Glu-tRNA(Gln) amidotransferase A subunit family amidase